MVALNIVRESLLLAVQELYNNKLRSFLSLLGITIGILCIVSVLTAVDSLERNLQDSISRLGDNTLYVQKWPWAMGGSEYPWWKYWKRPVPTYDEFKALSKNLQLAETVMIQLILNNKTIKYGSRSAERAEVNAVSENWDKIADPNFVSGRYFTQQELTTGANRALIGYVLAEGLFDLPEMAIGKEVKVLGQKFEIIGVMEKEGEDLIGMSKDNDVIIPFTAAMRFIDLRKPGVEPMILVKANPGVELEDLKDEITGVMRPLRKLKPRQEDDFALNQVSILSSGIQAMFGIVNLAGWFIGIFSILVGGFGIANIMFVSVKERTSIIGIKKALGARNYFILLEFLIESIVLCLAGGLLGMGLVFIMTLFAENVIDFKFTLSLKNILTGISLSVGIGLISGFVPSLMAARMNPVDAIRYK